MRKIYQSDLEGVVNELVVMSDSIQIAVRDATRALLEADLQVARWKKDGVKIKGEVRAKIVQACVVTLEPVESLIEEPVEAIFVPEGSRLARIAANDSGEMVLDPDGPDIPDVFTGDTIDAGGVVAEHVAMAIDPYPRKQGASFGERIESTDKDDARPNPFAALKDWKKD